MSTRRRPLVAVAAAAAILVFGATRVLAGPSEPSYHTVAVRHADVTDAVRITGAVSAATQTRVNFKIPGRLASTLVSVGQQVTAGQPLARLETGDMELALAQAKATVASAQSKYEQVVAGASPQDIAVARQAVDNAERSLDETRRTTATDQATAQQSFTSLKAAYAAAQSGYQLLGTAVPTDVGTFTSGLDAGRFALASALVHFTTMSTSDITVAKGAIGQADAALANAQSATSQLTGALSDWQSARDGLIAAWLQFDGTIQRGTDTSGAVTQYQSAQLAYTNASAHLQSALDAEAAQVALAQQSAAVAQAALQSSTSRTNADLDQPRADLVGFQSAMTSESQLDPIIKGKLGQMTSDVAVIAGAIGGGYVSAQQAVATTQERSANAVLGAQNSYDAAKATLDRTAAPARSFDIAGAYAAVLAAQTAVDKATSDLGNADLLAPSAGVVTSINAQPGEFVVGGSAANPFIVLSDTATVTLHGNVDEADIARLKLGQAAGVVIDALGPSSLAGRVTTLDPVATIQQGVPVYGIDVIIDSLDPRIRAGMAGSMRIVVDEKRDALVVPSYSIRQKGDVSFVQALHEGKVVDVTVRPGISDGVVTEVSGGVAEGDAVLVPVVGGLTPPGGSSR